MTSKASSGKTWRSKPTASAQRPRQAAAERQTLSSGEAIVHCEYEAYSDRRHGVPALHSAPPRASPAPPVETRATRGRRPLDAVEAL